METLRKPRFYGVFFFSCAQRRTRKKGAIARKLQPLFFSFVRTVEAPDILSRPVYVLRNILYPVPLQHPKRLPLANGGEMHIFTNSRYNKSRDIDAAVGYWHNLITEKCNYSHFSEVRSAGRWNNIVSIYFLGNEDISWIF